MTFVGERGIPSGATVGGVPEIGIDFGFMGTTEDFLGHRREVSERRDSEEALITVFVAGERNDFFRSEKSFAFLRLNV